MLRLDLSGYYVYRWNTSYSTHVHIFGARALSRFGPVYLGLEGAMSVGSTREIATAYKAIRGIHFAGMHFRSDIGARGEKTT